MNSKDRHIALLSAIGMMMLILDSKTALQGAANGIELCFRTLIPSLYPFFVLSILLTSALSAKYSPGMISPVWLSFIGAIFPI